MRKQIKTEWESAELGSITPTQVQQWVVRLAADLSPASVRKIVQQMLGHASATMTLDLYGHLFDDRLDEVADALDAARAAASC